MRKPTPEKQAYYDRSNANLRDTDRMITEMESAGWKVVRRDRGEGTGAELIVPEIIMLRGEDDEFYPNAVRDLYDQWIKQELAPDFGIADEDVDTA